MDTITWVFWELLHSAIPSPSVICRCTASHRVILLLDLNCLIDNLVQLQCTTSINNTGWDKFRNDSLFRAETHGHTVLCWKRDKMSKTIVNIANLLCRIIDQVTFFIWKSANTGFSKFIQFEFPIENEADSAGIPEVVLLWHGSGRTIFHSVSKFAVIFV